MERNARGERSAYPAAWKGPAGGMDGYGDVTGKGPPLAARPLPNGRSCCSSDTCCSRRWVDPDA